MKPEHLEQLKEIINRHHIPKETFFEFVRYIAVGFVWRDDLKAGEFKQLVKDAMDKVEMWDEFNEWMENDKPH